MKEHGNADEERDDHDCPVHASLSEQCDERGRDARGTAGLRHHLAQHRAEGDHDCDESQNATDAVLERFDHGGERHPRRCAQAKGYDDQRNEGMEFEDRDQDDQRKHRQEGVEQQERVWAHAARFTKSATIASGVSRISHTHVCSSGAGSSSVAAWLSSRAGGMK